VRQELVLHDGGLDARLVLTAGDEQPVTLGLHPWFARRLARGGQLQLDVRPLRQYQRDETGLPTGALTDPLPRPWDDCFAGLAAPPRLVWPGALELELDSGTDHWVVFDERPDVVCVEPQTGPPDAVRLGRADVVRAGDELALGLGLRWTVR
jgi:aldose 1-epimerase